VYAALTLSRAELGPRRIEVPDLAVAFAPEDGDALDLLAVLRFRAEVALERRSGGAEHAEVVPPALLRMRTQLLDGAGRNDHEVGALTDVMRDAVVSVDPHRAQRTRTVVRRAVHEVV